MIELQLTPGQAVILQNGLKHFSTKTLPFKASYAIMRNLDKIGSTCTRYVDVLRERYLSADGKLGQDFDLELWSNLDKTLHAELDQPETFSLFAISLPDDTEISSAELELIKQLLA